MKYYVLILMVFFLTSCYSKYSKDDFKGTKKLNDSLFVECYLVYSGGVFASNSNSYYLTDSLNFRAYLYTITEDKDRLYVDLKNNILWVYKITPKDTIEVNRVDIIESKREGVFD